jgi:hypothetical protein
MIAQNFDSDIVELRDKQTRSPGFFRAPKTVATQKKEGSVPEARVDRAVSARIFPNGEFGVGFVPRKKMSASDRRYDADCRYAEENAEIQCKVVLDDNNEVLFYGREKILPVRSPKLGIGTESSQGRKKYGLKGITGHGRKMLRNAGYILDVVVKSSKRCYPQMGTLTIPSLAPERMAIIAQRWNDIVRRFFQECRRRYRKLGKEFDYASCTEIQPARWDTRREVGLHLHFLFLAYRVAGSWSLPDQWVRDTWRRVLITYVGEVDIPGNLNYRRDTVRQSSAAYIAKYASKGAEFIQEVLEECGEKALPSVWWSMSSRLRRCIKKHTVSSSGIYADMLLAICTELSSEYLRYKRKTTMLLTRTEYALANNCPQAIVLGYGGMLSNSGCALFLLPDIKGSIRKYMSSTLDKPSCN